MELEGVEELLFFETFSHDTSEEINLDLVQFPKPVIISEIRIIPLGARVQADFPGGVRLGATNPSQFHVEFFVNDLSKHGASTFENLGELEYRQISDIQFQCNNKKIPTDGLVLRGWYTTITLAVYGGLSAGIPPPPPDPRVELSASAATAEWVQSQQAAMYMDPPFTYPPPDFPPAVPQHPYVETWTAPPVTAPPPMVHADVYEPPKDYGTPPSWEPPPEEIKPWSGVGRAKEDGKALSPRSSVGSGSRGRRSDYWEERDDRRTKRFKDLDTRNRPKARREGSWDENKSSYSDSNHRRRPKSPPSRSPKRPYTPTEQFWSPERKGYRSPGDRFPDDARPVSPAKRRSDIGGSPVRLVESPGSRPLPGDGSLGDDEPFEPILSDEEIVDEAESPYQEGEFDFPDDIEDVVKTFNPYSYQINQPKSLTNPCLTQCESLVSPEEEALAQLTEALKYPFEPTEDWITSVDQVVSLLPRALAGSVASELKQKLFQWVEEGFNLEVAQRHDTPGAKLRHIKTVIRLAKTLCRCKMAGELCRRGLQRWLLSLFHCDYMALSIRLLILQALDATLIDHDAMEIFLNERWILDIAGESELCSTYQHILRMLAVKQLVRIKFALTSIMQKAHVEELLDNINALATNMADKIHVDDDHLFLNIEGLTKMYCQAYLLAQPRRLLPVQAQFEVKVETESAYTFLYRYFKHHKLLEAFSVILRSRECSQNVSAAIYEFLRELSTLQHGLIFLSCTSTTTNDLLRVLQTAEEFNEHGQQDCQLGVELAFKLHALECVDSLRSVEEEGAAFDILHGLFCATNTAVGKVQTAFVMSLDDNIAHLVSLAKQYGKKSAILGYVCDIATMTIRYSDCVEYLKQTAHNLLELFSTAEPEEKLTEFIPWLRPADIHFGDLPSLAEILKQHAAADFSGNVSGELITTVRLLRLLCAPKVLLDDCKATELLQLKFKHATLQLYSLDGLSNLTSIVTKILGHYEQPFLHSVGFSGSQGYAIFSFLETAVLLVERILVFLVEAREKEYKDLTHVSVLVEVYILAQAVPMTAEAYGPAQRLCGHVIDTLLTYTQRAAQTDNYAKSIWTLMLSEVIKTTMKAPYCFIPGFSLLNELLPLPLPIYSKAPLSPSDVDMLRNVRQLWSAHIHPLAGALHDLLATLASSCLAPLLEVMRRVATQLADLAAPTALIVARAVLDPLSATLTRSTGGWKVPVSPQAARLLQFLSCLVANHSIKAAVLSLITPGANARTDEKLITFGEALGAILRTPGNTVYHSQAQDHVVFLIHTLVDPEVSLVPQTNGLANALPARDVITSFVGALVDHISAPDNPLPTLVHVLKALLLFTDHDYGFYHLKMALTSQPGAAVWNMISRLCTEVTKDNGDALNALHFTFTLLRELKLDSPTSVRSRTMTKAEIAKLLRWGAQFEDDQPHPLRKIHNNLKEWSATDESLGNLFLSADNAINSLSEPDDAPLQSVKEDEPVLGVALPLMEQFALRPIYITAEPEVKTLSSAYWLPPAPLDDVDPDSDQIPCDLLEMSGTLLPALHLSGEVQRLCRLKSSDLDQDGKKPEANKYQLAGARTKRPFIAPMRGRGGRTAPQRGDLFRSRAPNTSRPPSLHVDDFVALETCGQQPTGPTGYNKVSVRNVKDVIGTRGRGRGRIFGGPSYPRRDSPRGGGRGRGVWNHDDLRPPMSRFRPWPVDDMRRNHPFQR